MATNDGDFQKLLYHLLCIDAHGLKVYSEHTSWQRYGKRHTFENATVCALEMMNRIGEILIHFSLLEKESS